MSQKKITVITMLGMNRFTMKDTKWKFPPLPGDFPTTWLTMVSKREKTHSTPFYEVGMAIKQCADTHRIPVEEIQLINGRGTIFRKTESELYKILTTSPELLNKESFTIIVAKSLGVCDTLRVLHRFTKKDSANIGDIHLFISIDPYAPSFHRRGGILKKVKIGQSKKNRLIYPPNVNTVINIYQDKSYPKGFKAGTSHDRRITNINIKKAIHQAGLPDSKLIYDRYESGYQRHLDICHNDMEELVSIVPCFPGEQGAETLGSYIQSSFDSFVRA